MPTLEFHCKRDDCDFVYRFMYRDALKDIYEFHSPIPSLQIRNARIAEELMAHHKKTGHRGEFEVIDELDGQLGHISRYSGGLFRFFFSS